jgi:hypothetical protein
MPSKSFGAASVVESKPDISARYSFGALRFVVLFFATELVLLVWIRDGPLLNVVMLFFGSSKLRAWQAGH